MPEFLDAKVVTQLAEEFKLDLNSDWMDTTELPAPSSGAGIKIFDDGFTELENLEGESDEEMTNEDEEEADDKINEESIEGITSAKLMNSKVAY